MQVMLRVENYNDASYVAFSNPNHVLRGNELLTHVREIICTEKLATIDGLDFTDVSDGSGDHRVTFCHDEEQVILKVEGHNGKRSDFDYFNILANQTIQTLREDLGCDQFTLKDYIETKELCLNQYNVLLITWSDAIRVAILSISEEMAWRIMGMIVKEPIDAEERVALLKASVSELTNIVMGQSIKYFNDQIPVVLGTPLLIQAQPNTNLLSEHPIKQSVCGSVDQHIKLFGINY
jgi:CheY-specific phosphatase CheX